MWVICCVCKIALTVSPSQRRAPTTIAPRSQFRLGLCSCSTSLSKMGTRADPRAPGQRKWGHIRNTFYTFLENSICGNSICFPKINISIRVVSIPFKHLVCRRGINTNTNTKTTIPKLGLQYQFQYQTFSILKYHF